MLGQGVAESILATWLLKIFSAPVWGARVIGCKTIRRSKPLRVSFSALLKVQNGSEYLLVRNLHRPETFGPIGGVYKYYSDAVRDLDDLEFEQQIIGTDGDMDLDLRGFLPRKNVLRIIKWFKAQADRENYQECLSRELREELAEVKLSRRVPSGLRFRLVRSVSEGPYHVDGEDYTQFRIFDVYEMLRDTSTSKKFYKWLCGSPSRHENLVWATAEEIRKGRHLKTNDLIGHHSGYLIWAKRIRPDTPMFATTKSSAAP